MRHNKIDADTTLYEIAHNGIVDDEHLGSGAIVQTKRDVFTKMTTRPSRELPFDASNPDGWTHPLDRRGQVEKITQKWPPPGHSKKVAR